jgi:hypothetical protein
VGIIGKKMWRFLRRAVVGSVEEVSRKASERDMDYHQVEKIHFSILIVRPVLLW